MTSTERELLPCPFCGAPDPPFGHSWAGGFFGTVSCGDCGAEVNSGIGATSADEAQAEAITAWNTRTPSNTRGDALEEALTKIVEETKYVENPYARTAHQIAIRALNPTNPTAGQSGETIHARVLHKESGGKFGTLEPQCPICGRQSAVTPCPDCACTGEKGPSHD